MSDWDTQLEVLGWEIDTAALTIALPSKKLHDLCELIIAWPVARRTATVTALRRLIGKLLHVSQVVRPGSGVPRTPSVFRDVGLRLLRNSIAGSSERTYEAGFRSWIKYRSLCKMSIFVSGELPTQDWVWQLMDFAAWCCGCLGNQAKTISGKLAAIKYFHRVRVNVELPITHDLLKKFLKGITRCPVNVGTQPRLRRPISWDMILTGRELVQSWGEGGKILWLCLGLSYFFLTRAGEVFANEDRSVGEWCLKRNHVAFFEGDRQLRCFQWPSADRVEVRFDGGKGDQMRRGTVISRYRHRSTQGSDWVAGLGGDAVALMMELMSCHPSFPGDTPIAAFRRGDAIQVWSRAEAVQRLRQIVEKCGQKPDEFALHSLRIGGATCLGSGRDIPQHVIRSQGRWRSETAHIGYRRSNEADSELASSRLSQTGGQWQKQPGRDTNWGLM